MKPKHKMNPKMVRKLADYRKRKGKRKLRVQRVVIPPWELGQVIRHKITGDMASITAIHGEIVRAEPTTICHLIRANGYSQWEAV